MERLKCERDKLRITCSEANDRVSFLAQEIDEQHAKQEKKRIDEIKQLDGKNAETVRQLTDQLNREREAHAAALKAAEEKYLAVQREEQRCRKELADLLKEFHGLETENQSLLEQIDGVKHANNELLKKIRILDAEQEEVIVLLNFFSFFVRLWILFQQFLYDFTVAQHRGSRQRGSVCPDRQYKATARKNSPASRSK